MTKIKGSRKKVLNYVMQNSSSNNMSIGKGLHRVRVKRDGFLTSFPFMR
jgi:hypothetical protein